MAMLASDEAATPYQSIPEPNPEIIHSCLH